jgi:tetratricopeptide (TPR) repeat protein
MLPRSRSFAIFVAAIGKGSKHQAMTTTESSLLSHPIKIFFSYDPRDEDLLNRLKAHLSVLKREFIDEWYDSDEIIPGSNINEVTEAHLCAASIIVLLISADFLASERCYEIEMKRALDLSKTANKPLIPVILRPADWQTSPLSQYSPLPPPDGKPVILWKNLDDALTAVARGIRKVVEEIAQRTKGRQARPLPPQFPLYHIPYRSNVFFTDRDEILSTIAASFSTAQAPHPPVLALIGLGGMGKTQVALAYSYLYARSYQVILWLDASSRDHLSMDVRAQADRLSLPVEDSVDESHLFDAFKRWLQEQENWLLVLDQVDDMALVNLVVPLQGSGHVLLTTRTQATGTYVSPIFIEQMTRDASITLLLHRAGLLPKEASLEEAPPAAVQDATALVQEMDGLPLALDQAGAYLQETGCSFATYLTFYRQQRTTLLGQRGRFVGSHPNSVMVTFHLAFEQVKQKRAENLDLLRLLAFLHPDSIPDQLLLQGASELSGPLQPLATQPLVLYQALADLLSFSLVHRRADTATLCIHRIVQTILIDDLAAEQRSQWAEQVVRMVNRVFPEVPFDTWDACELYRSQAQRCATLINDFQLTLKEGALLLQRLGLYCYQRGCYVEAETYLTQALSLHEHHQWTDALQAARALQSLALLYHRQARYQEAEALHQRALEMREQAFGPDHPETAESLHNFAALYLSQGQYQRAEQFYQRVLALDEHLLGSADPETAKTLNNLGLTCYMQGNYTQAETAYQRALSIYERTPGFSDHLDLAYTLNSLGTLYEKLGNYQRAGELYQRALSIREQVLGDEHPETARSLNKLADIYEIQGNYQQAEELYRRALTICEQALGDEHLDIALFLNNLAFIASKQERYQQAEPLYRRALNIYEQALGDEHPVVASVLNNLGQLYRNTKDEERAEALLRHALAIRKQALGTTHPDTAQSMANLADLLTDQHAYEEAEPLFQQALAIRLQAFGPTHPDVVLTREKYAILLERTNRSEEAAALRHAN